MLKLTIAFVLLVICGTASAQQTLMTWPQWVATNQATIERNKVGIEATKKYRDEICAQQKSELEKGDCTSLFNIFLHRREDEQKSLNELIALSRQPAATRDAKIGPLNEAYNKAQKRTSSMFDWLMVEYKRPAATVGSGH